MISSFSNNACWATPWSTEGNYPDLLPLVGLILLFRTYYRQYTNLGSGNPLAQGHIIVNDDYVLLTTTVTLTPALGYLLVTVLYSNRLYMKLHDAGL